MLLSMTGFGEGRTRTDALDVTCEIRSVNNRHLKVTVRCPDFWASFEGDIEKLIRKRLARGTVQVAIRVRRADGASGQQINQTALGDYFHQLKQTAAALQINPPSLDALLVLPGVAEDQPLTEDPQTDWPTIERTVNSAVERLVEYRRAEGLPMEADLREQVTVIRDNLEKVQRRAPEIVTTFRDRIHDRVKELLADSDVVVDSSDLLREVSIFADRCDINEEVTRLRTHLEQFDSFLSQKTSQGRKLDFLGQEVFRETNTIGSKANDVEIAHCVVEMKAAIEKIREILANVE